MAWRSRSLEKLVKQDISRKKQDLTLRKEQDAHEGNLVTVTSSPLSGQQNGLLKLYTYKHRLNPSKRQTLLSWAQRSLWIVAAATKLKDTCLVEEKL